MVTPLSEKKGNLDSFFPLFYNFSDETNLFFHSYTAQPDPFPVPGSVRGGMRGKGASVGTCFAGGPHSPGREGQYSDHPRSGAGRFGNMRK